MKRALLSLAIGCVACSTFSANATINVDKEAKKVEKKSLNGVVIYIQIPNSVIEKLVLRPLLPNT